MFHNKRFILKEGAFLVADVHYSLKNQHFYSFLEAISSKKLQPSQLLLVGDIFDALFGEIPQTYKDNQKVITLLNQLSSSLEIIYFEGNHDFNIKNIFPNIIILERQKQPTLFSFKDKKVAILHGDYNMGISYEIFSAFLRNKFVLKGLNFINFLCFDCVMKKLQNHLAKKDNCKKIPNFFNIIQQRYRNNREYDYIIEGHFHQNKIFIFDEFSYINLASFACNQRYFIVKSLQDKKELLQEAIFLEE